ncbi:hypothetical protein BC938DRAFT_477580 [Jimgerdemannia flammicorona]|uniref:Glycosyltransferase 2-like domain-containing protein n=1 Tax=Jimgerdemannia flammicorona TaxID=994334 RepID=A0A433QP51_9FUNG|nr:hypothetical protein BC938DRAFT_477580 [Jimgerdemannia flammicorona]
MKPLNFITAFAVWLLCAETVHAQPPFPGSTRRIPKTVHFVYGLHSPDPQLNLMQYISIAAAWESIRPEKIYFWYYYEPTGHYWNLAKERFVTDTRQVRLVDEIFGNKVEHYAHRADVIRLEALQEIGGIYLDLDVIMMRGVDELLDNEFVMGEEGEVAFSFFIPTFSPALIGTDARVGLCNAVILAHSNSTFLRRLYDSYHTFDDTQWNDHSGFLPKSLAYLYPTEIHVLPYTSFFWPLWTTSGMQRLYTEKVHQFVGSGAYAVHLWENVAMKYALRGVGIETIEGVPTAFFCTIRKFLLVKGRLMTEKDRLAIASTKMDLDCVVPDDPRRNDGLSTRIVQLRARPADSPRPSRRELQQPPRLAPLLDTAQHAPEEPAGVRVLEHIEPPADADGTLYFDGRGDFAVLPTLPHGFDLHEFTVDFWLRIPTTNYTEFSRRSEMQHKTVLAILSDGDWSDPPNSDEQQGTGIIIQLQKFRPSPLARAMNITAQRWMVEVLIKGTKASIAHWGPASPELGLRANQWYRIHVTGSRDTQKLNLDIGYPLTHSGPFLANPPVDNNTLLTHVRESKYYIPSVIKPARAKAIWLAAHPPSVMNAEHNVMYDFRGWIDDLVIANKVVMPEKVDAWLKEAADALPPRSSNHLSAVSDLFPKIDIVDTTAPDLEDEETVEIADGVSRTPLSVHPVSSIENNRHAVELDDEETAGAAVTAHRNSNLWLINLDLLPILLYMMRAKKFRAFNLFWLVMFFNVFVIVLNQTTSWKPATPQQTPSTSTMKVRRAPEDFGLAAEDDLPWGDIPVIKKVSTTPPDVIALNFLGYDSREPEMKAKKNSPVISVIVSCHNQAQYVQDAIASVLNQTYPYWDLAILDDGSPDNCSVVSQNILQRYFPQHQWITSNNSDSYRPLADALATRYKEGPIFAGPRSEGDDHSDAELSYLFPNLEYKVNQLVAPAGLPGKQLYTPAIRIFKKPNTGLPATRNFALHHMRNPWVCLLEADDKLHHRYFQLAMHYLLEENPAYRILTTNQQSFQNSSWVWATPQHWSATNALIKTPFPVSSLFRRDDWRILKGGFNPMLPWGSEDWSFWISLSWLPGMKVGKINKQTVINCLRDLNIERNRYQSVVGIGHRIGSLRLPSAVVDANVTLLDRVQRQNLGITYASWRSILLKLDISQLKAMSWIGFISNYDRPIPSAAERQQGEIYPSHDGLAFFLYRFKAKSMQPTNSEVMPMMRTLHPFEYGVTKILQDHRTMHSAKNANPFITQDSINEITRMANRLKVPSIPLDTADFGTADHDTLALDSNRYGLGVSGEAGLWLGLWYESQDDIVLAQQSYIRALSQRKQGRRILISTLRGQQSEEDPNERKRFDLEAAITDIAESTIVGGVTERDWQLWWRLGIVTHQLLAGSQAGTNGLPDSNVGGLAINNTILSDLLTVMAIPTSAMANKFCDIAVTFAGKDLEQYLSECTDPEPSILEKV